MDFFDFVGGLAFICLRVFDLAPTRFELVFDLTHRFGLHPVPKTPS
jgi:hypothetical protein